MNNLKQTLLIWGGFWLLIGSWFGVILGTEYIYNYLGGIFSDRVAAGIIGLFYSFILMYCVTFVSNCGSGK